MQSSITEAPAASHKRDHQPFESHLYSVPNVTEQGYSKVFLVYFPRLRFLEGTPDSPFIVLGGTTCLFSNQGMIPLPGSVYNTQLRDKIIKGLWKWEDQCQDPVHRPTTITAHMGLIQSAVTVSEFSRSGICRVSEKSASVTFAKGLCCHCFVKQATHNGTRNDWAWEDLFIADYCKSHYYPVIHPCG